MRALPLLFLVAACGSAAKDQPPDASIPDATTCTAPMMTCGDECIDPAADEAHCGDCTTACDPGDVCTPGGCAAAASCAELLAEAPGTPDGSYEINPGSGSIRVFCDMTHGGVTYEKLAFGQHDSSPLGYTEVSLADLQDPVISKAFIALFNQQGGAALNANPGFASMNCCVMLAGSDTQVLELGGLYIYPAAAASDESICNPSGGYTDASYRFYFAEDGPFSPNPLPADFFTQHPPTQETNCAFDTNPGFFWLKG